MTQSLDLNKMGLTPMNETEINNLNGGGFFKDYLIGKAIDWVIERMAEDWNSRSGGPASITDRYAARGPY